MNLRQLQYFYETSQTESFSKTAEKYTVPASAVSASVKRLESELGVQLFDRTANKIRLSEKGRIFAHELRGVFAGIDSAVSKISQHSCEPPAIRILIRARPKWITELITEYKLMRPDVNFIISNDYTLSDYSNFDVIIDEDSAGYANCEKFLLSIEIICIKASSSSPLVGKELAFSQLENEVFVLPESGNGMRRLYETMCARHKIRPNVAIECNDRQCLQHYVSSGMGLTLGACRALEDHTQNNISPLKVIDFNETQSVYVFFDGKKNNNSALRDFLDFLYSKRYI